MSTPGRASPRYRKYENTALAAAVEACGGPVPVAKRLGVSECTLSNWLHGDYLPTAGEYRHQYTRKFERKLERVLGVTAASVFPPRSFEDRLIGREVEEYGDVRSIPVGKRWSLFPRVDQLVDTSSTLDGMIAAEEWAEMDKAISLLPPRWSKIVRLRLQGLDLRQVAARVGVSHERVRQVQAKATRRIASYIRRRYRTGQ